MKIYSLTGKSGTGKSFQAIDLCKKINIKGIIDDGLFIYENKVIEGISAKRNSTTIGAIKTALFLDEEHRKKTRKAIHKLNPESILIIGTSKEMVNRIAKALELPSISKYILIEDITSNEEIMKAQNQRNIYGKHVVPVPTLQLKRDFAGYFLNPVKFFKEFTKSYEKEEVKFSVVRPTYSYMGNFYIMERVFVDIAKCLVTQFDCIDKVINLYSNTSADNFIIDVRLKVKPKGNIFKEIEKYQKNLKKVTETMTAYNVVEVNVYLQ